jgi:hypothetical protein
MEESGIALFFSQLLALRYVSRPGETFRVLGGWVDPRGRLEDGEKI